MAAATKEEFDWLLWYVLIEAYENDYWLTRAELDYIFDNTDSQRSARILDDGPVFSTQALHDFWEPAISELRDMVYDMERGAAALERPAISGLLHMREAVAPAMNDMFETRGTVSSKGVLVMLLTRYDTAFWRRIVLKCMVYCADDILKGDWVDEDEMAKGDSMLAALHEIGAVGIAGHPVCELEAAAEVAERRVPGNSDLGIGILNILGVPRVPRSVFAGGRWGAAPRGLVATRGRVPSSSHQRSHLWYRDGRVGFGRRQPG